MKIHITRASISKRKRTIPKKRTTTRNGKRMIHIKRKIPRMRRVLNT